MTFTKEQLIERCEEAIASLKPCTGLAETKSLACFEIALSALAGREAVPVAEVQISRGGYDRGEKVINYIQEEIQSLPVGAQLYTAPQPLTTSERAELENYRNAQQVVPDVEPYMHGLWPNAVDALMRYANDCRAAMLQGKAEPATAQQAETSDTPPHLEQFKCRVCGVLRKPFQRCECSKGGSDA